MAWDTQLPGELTSRWSKWEKGLPDKVTVPRALVAYREPINGIALHAFGMQVEWDLRPLSTMSYNSCLDRLRDW